MKSENYFGLFIVVISKKCSLHVKEQSVVTSIMTLWQESRKIFVLKWAYVGEQ